ncbi:MAG: helix-turn-helix domain-containing protein, partial [Spirochaetes bacterium]|nr:helix-turn-helix domain-containing protein [Spirochaetota bacterium]
VGKIPFDAENLMGILTAHLYHAPTPPRAFPECENLSPAFEAVLPDRRASFRCASFHLSNFPFHYHHHPEWELTLIVKGQGLRYVGESVEAYIPGDLCLLGPGLPHTWSSEPAGGPVESVVLQILPAYLETILRMEEWHGVRRLMERGDRGLHFDGPQAASAAEAFRELAHRPPASPRRFTDLLALLAGLAEECRVRELCVSRSASVASAAIAPVLAYIHAHAGEALDQALVADRTGMAPSAFSRWFRRHVGRPWVDYVQEVRLARACRALSETDDPVLRIALEAGFKNLSHFHKVFKKSRGWTPAAYREKFKA